MQTKLGIYNFYILFMVKLRILTVILCAGVLCFAQNVNKSSKSVRINVDGLPTQYTALRVDTLSRCIVSLPDAANLTAFPEGRTEYLKNISGTNKSEYVKIWNAKVQLVYQQKYRLNYLLIPQGGMETGSPVFRETDGTMPVSEAITGDPQESDFFAFANPRRYYFNSPEMAMNSAVKHAKQRISELKGLLCNR
jgi:hypothetical protein